MEKSKRQIQKEQTKEKIIKAAFKVYSEGGFTTATSTIAKEAGVAHGSIFLHFPTLEDLICCLLAEFENSIGAKFLRLSETDGGIEELLGAHIDILSEYEQFYTRLISEATLLPISAKTLLTKLQSDLAANFNRLIEQGVEEKIIRRLPVNLLFNTWIGLIHYYLSNSESFAQDGQVLKRYKKQLIFTYCELIRR